MLALELVSWLDKINDRFRPWMSERDLRKGKPWMRALAERLSSCRAGIFCLTPENTEEAWMLFEAGALSGRESRVCTLLLYGTLRENLKDGPFEHFQHTVFNPEDVQKL